MESSAWVYIGLTIVTVLFALLIQSRRCATAPGEGDARAGLPYITRAGARGSVAEFAVFCLLTAVSACRIAVGNDYWPYRFNFRLIAQERHVSSEFGFNLIVKWMQEIFGYDNYLPIFALFSFLTVLFFVRALHNQAANYALSLFLLMTGGYYFNSLNTVRYYLALAIALYSMGYVLRKEYGKFILWILFGAIFHKSILLVIPVYLTARFLASARLKKWHYALGAALTLSLVVCRDFYREIIFYFYPYYRDSAFAAGGISWVNTAKCVGTLVLCAICYRRVLKGDETARFYFFLNVAGLVVYLCGTFIPEVTRVGYYMIISQVFLLPRLLTGMERGWLRSLSCAGVVTAFGVYFAFLLKGMYATDIRLLPYLTWIFN